MFFCFCWNISVVCLKGSKLMMCYGWDSSSTTPPLPPSSSPSLSLSPSHAFKDLMLHIYVCLYVCVCVCVCVRACTPLHQLLACVCLQSKCKPVHTGEQQNASQSSSPHYQAVPCHLFLLYFSAVFPLLLSLKKTKRTNKTTTAGYHWCGLDLICCHWHLLISTSCN